MATTTRTAIIALQYQSTGTAAVIRDNQAMIAALGASQKATAAEQVAALKLQDQLANIDRARAFRKLAEDAAAGITPLDQVLQKVTDLNATDAELKKLASDMDAFANSAQRAAVATQQVPKGIRDIGIQTSALPDPSFGSLPGEAGISAGQRLSKLSTEAVALPGIGYQSPIVQGLRGVGILADKTGASLLELGAAGGIAGAAIIAVIVALQHFKEELAADKTRLDGALAANKNYYEAVQTLTTQQVNEQIATLQRSRAALTENAANLGSALEREFQQASSGIGGQLSARVNDALGNTPYQQLKEQADAANKALQENIDTETRLTQGRDSGAFAANDLTEAEKKLADEREKVAEQLAALTDQDANNRVRLAALRRSGSSDQVNEELAANQDRETILRNFLIPGVKSLGLNEAEAAKRSQELATELQNLTDTDKLLADSVLPVIQRRENEIALTKAQKDQSDALNDVLMDISKTQIDLANSSKKADEAYHALQQSTDDHNAKLVEIDATRDDAIQKARIKASDQLIKIDQQTSDRIRDLKAQDDLSIIQNVASGNIAAIQATLANQRLKVAQENRQAQEQKNEAQKNADDQIKAANDQNAKLLKAEQERYDKELATRRAAYNQAVQDEQALTNRLKSLRDQQQEVTRYWISAVVLAQDKLLASTASFANGMQAYAAQINASISGRSGGSTGPLTSAGYALGSSAANAISTFFSGIRSQVGVSGSPLPAVSGYQPGAGGLGNFHSYAVGTNYVPFDMMAIVHKGEAIVPASQNNGGSAVTINVDARNSNWSEAEWKSRIEPVKVEIVEALAARHAKVKK